MDKVWILSIAVVLCVTFTLLFWKVFGAYFKNECGPSVWKRGGKVYFWQGAVLVGMAGTYLIMHGLKWSNVLVY